MTKKPFHTKILSGQELAGFIKERQAHQVAKFNKPPKLVILRDSNNPVIMKYVALKIRYGADINIEVEDRIVPTNELTNAINELNHDSLVDAMIVQLPILDTTITDDIVTQIIPAKDVDNLSGKAPYTPATAEAIDWLLTGYDIKLAGKRIAIVGQGRLVGAPLYNLWKNAGHDITVFTRGSNLTDLIKYDIIVSATGVPGLIASDFVKNGAVIVDAGTTSDHGVIKGDVGDSVRERTDLTAITPITGGVGPLTISVLFDHVITARSA